MLQSNPYTYSRSELRFYLRGRAIDPALQKAGAEAVIRQSRFKISDITLKLQQGQMSTEDWYAQMKEHTKLAHMANAALARGGFQNVSPADWKKVEQKILDQWAGVGEPPFKQVGEYPGLRRFAEDVERGRYGAAVPAVTDATGKVTRPASVLNGMVTQRSGQYANASRATYENTRTESHQESGFLFATRIPGAVDHCPGCSSEGNVKRPIDEVLPIGAAECGSACHCVLIYSRD